MYDNPKVPSRRNKQIGENLRLSILRAKRRNSALTQREIARVANINPVTLSRIIAGSGASRKTITKIAEAIGADPEKILTNGMRTPKYTARTLDEVINNWHILNQFVGGTDEQGLVWLRNKLVSITTAIRKHNLKIEREQYE